MASQDFCPYCGKWFDSDYYINHHVPCPERKGDRACTSSEEEMKEWEKWNEEQIKRLDEEQRGNDDTPLVFTSEMRTALEDYVDEDDINNAFMNGSLIEEEK